MAVTGKIAEVYFEKALEEYEHQMQMLDMVDTFEAPGGDLQNSNNVVWRPVQQHAPIINGFDLTNLEKDIIEETYPAILGDPANDFFEQRVDDLRDMRFWERRGQQSGKRQATELNKRLAQLVADTGSLFYRSNATSGYDFIAEGQALLNERQSAEDMRYYVLNDRSNLKFAQDLAGRQTLQGRPEDTWKTGQIGSNIAEFDVYTGSYLPTIAGGAITTSTVSADVSNKPEGGSVNTTTGTVTNIDYRIGTIPAVATATYAVGDRISFTNDPGGTPIVVDSVGLADKNETGQAMTFVITAIPDGTTLNVFPKPIAGDDPALTTLEKAYANISTQILSGAEIVKLNTVNNEKINAFWCKNSIEVFSGDAPIGLLAEFGGMKVVSSTMSNGQKMYMAYDGNIDKLTFKCRLFTWYGITNKNPMANGVGISF